MTKLLKDKPKDSEDYRNAERAQSEAADPHRSAWISANAGSGKTKVLIDRVARLLLRRDGREGAKPDSILCITYTKAAANEMLSRLYRKLGEWSVMEDDKLRKQLAVLENRKAGDYSPEDLKAARALFARALETPGGLRIETIHAFCARVLQRFPLEAGVLPGFQQIEEDEAAAIWSAACRHAILSAVQERPQALAILSREGGHEGALAGLHALRASFDKVEAFVRRHSDESKQVAALRELLNAPDVSVDDIVTDAVEGEAFPKALIQSAIPLLETGKKGDIATAEKLRLALDASDTSDVWAHYLSVFQTGEGKWRKSNPYTKGTENLSPDFASAFLMKDGDGSETARVRRIADNIKRAAAVERTAALIAVGWPALKTYRDIKRARGVLDFDDLIGHTKLLLTQSGMADWVLYKLDGGLSHVLLDEAQDTAPDQWTLLTELTQEFVAGKGRETPQEPRTMFVVGDEKQSIYSFQGAEPEMLRRELTKFLSRAPDTATRPMQMSFRSSPEILNFVDAVWNSAPPLDNPVSDAPPAAQDIIQHTARRSGQPGLVELWPVVEREEREDPDAWKRPLNVLKETNPKAKLARLVAESIRQMIDAGETVWEEGADRSWERRAMRPEDVLILVRNRTGGLFDAIIAALKTEGLPVAGADRLTLTDHIGVQDCLNLMRFALLPEDDLTLAEILRGPFGGLIDDDAYLYPLGHGRKSTPLWQRVKESDDPTVHSFADFLERVLSLRSLPAYEFLTAILDYPSMDGKTGWEKLNARLGAPAHDPIQALVSRALDFDAQTPVSLQGFVAEMDLDDSTIKRDLAAPDKEVRVMTVHGAKGLQAPVVILPDTTAAPKVTVPAVMAVDEVPVWAKSKSNDVSETEAAREASKVRALEEHRRLLYVALTRAADRLIVAGARHGSSKDGYDKRSWYALCLEAMDQLSPSDDEAEVANVRQLGNPPPTLPSHTSQSASEEELPAWALSAASMGQADESRFTAPTGLLSDGAMALAPLNDARAFGLRRGRLIHALFEYLPALAPEERPKRGQAFLAAEVDLSQDQRNEMLGAALTMMSDDTFSEIFQPGGRAEAAVVGTAPELPDGTIINGRVDRLVVTDEKVLIIDFKTDQPAPAVATDVGESYLVQMAAYWAVLRQVYPGKTVEAALCWTDGPSLMPLHEDLMLETLKTLSDTPLV